MGKGDKRTKRGKIAAGSFGNTRPRKKVVNKTAPAAVSAAVNDEKANSAEPETSES